MNSNSIKKLIRCSSIVSICILILLYAATQIKSYYREPEIPFVQLTKLQQEAIQSMWSKGAESDWHIWNNDDYTWGRYVIYMVFDYQNDLDHINQEFHVFANPLFAQIPLGPSPHGDFIDKPYVPKEWNYHPKYADYFRFGCNDGLHANFTRTCKVIVRYEEYVLVISTPIREYMTFADLERFLETTDTFMNAYLDNSILKPGKRSVPSSVRDLK